MAEGYALLVLYIIPSPFFLVAPWVLRWEGFPSLHSPHCHVLPNTICLEATVPSNHGLEPPNSQPWISISWCVTEMKELTQSVGHCRFERGWEEMRRCWRELGGCHAHMEKVWIGRQCAPISLKSSLDSWVEGCVRVSEDGERGGLGCYQEWLRQRNQGTDETAQDCCVARAQKVGERVGLSRSPVWRKTWRSRGWKWSKAEDSTPSASDCRSRACEVCQTQDVLQPFPTKHCTCGCRLSARWTLWEHSHSASKKEKRITGQASPKRTNALWGTSRYLVIFFYKR